MRNWLVWSRILPTANVSAKMSKRANKQKAEKTVDGNKAKGIINIKFKISFWKREGNSTGKDIQE